MTNMDPIQHNNMTDKTDLPQGKRTGSATMKDSKQPFDTSSKTIQPTTTPKKAEEVLSWRYFRVHLLWFAPLILAFIALPLQNAYLNYVKLTGTPSQYLEADMSTLASIPLILFLYVLAWLCTAVGVGYILRFIGNRIRTRLRKR